MSRPPASSNSSNPPRGGFTLIEALIALTLLTVGLIPAFIQASNALTLASSIQNSLVATHLAQEGVEVVRAMRDADWFAGAAFGTSLDACSAGCRVQWDSTAPLPLDNDPVLERDPLTGLFTYDTGTATGYRRQVTVTAGSAHERTVTVSVTWDEKSGAKKFELEDHLYDWLQ